MRKSISRLSVKIFVFLILLTTWNLYIRSIFRSTPASTVFDEVYYIRYSLAYCCSREQYSDLHPPLPKLIYGIPGYFSNYSGDYQWDAKESDPPQGDFNDFNIPFVRMRTIGTIIGTTFPVLVFALTWAISGSALAAILASVWVSFENAMLIHSNFVLLDHFLLCGLFCALFFYIKLTRCQSTSPTIMYAALTGFGLGVALGTKFTGLSAAAAIGLDLVYRLLRKQLALNVFKRQIAWIGLVFVIVYFGSWSIHEHLLNADFYKVNFLDALKQFIERIVTLHWSMLSGHLSLGSDDGLGSRWWQWLLGFKPLLLWQSEISTIYFFPNFIVWTGTGFVTLFFSWLYLLSRATEKLPVMSLPFTKYRVLLLFIFFAFVPNMFFSRVLYLYQYLPALCGLIVLNASLFYELGVLSSSTRSPTRSFWFLVTIPIFCFVFTLPFTYGVEQPWAQAIKEAVQQQVKWKF